MPARPIRNPESDGAVYHCGARHRVEHLRSSANEDGCSCGGTCEHCKENDAPS